ncbi:MAG: HAD hydrolase-like protein [Actinobacteria bacterium]|nr:HAD hydrolase-like protein [Actinomycetota bacterium]
MPASPGADAAEGEPPALLTSAVCEDRRLRPALVRLEQGRIGVLSLDIFDTLLWRIVPEPVDAFGLFGHRLMTLGYLDPGTAPAVFARLRQRAEERARALVGPAEEPQEVNLHQIYQQLPEHIFSGITPAVVADLEVEFEREITFPDLEILELARLAQEKYGARIVLVSDTYYSEKQIRRILSRPLFEGVVIDDVFTSSDRKVGKGFGLFDRVLEETGQRPEEVLHVGDHEDADVAAAAEAGIQAVHFERFSAATSAVLEEEGTLQARPTMRERLTTKILPPTTKRIGLDAVAGDFGLTAARSKSLARPEVDSLAHSAQPFWRFGASVLGPPSVAFAEWIHAQAHARGYTRVYCLMREGEFLSRLLDGAATYLANPVESRKFWASRQVTARAAIFDASREELTGFLNRRRPPTMRQFLEGLGLGLSTFPELFSHAEGRLDDPALFERVMDLIERRAEVRAAIVDDAALLRRRLLAYFEKEAGDQPRILLADLGWGATIQANLQTIFDRSGLGVQTEGLYLATNEAAVDRILNGVRAHGFLTTAGVPGRDSAYISRSPEIIEQAFMHDVGSLADYSHDGQPISGEARQDPVQMLQRVAVQSGILGFQQEWARYRPVVPASVSLLEPSAREQLRRMIMRFILRPTHEEAVMFSAWLHDDNFGSDDAESVVSSTLRTSLKYMTPEQYLALPTTKTFWPFGLAAIYEPSLSEAAAAVAEGLVSPEVFVHSDLHAMPIYLDDGSGFEERVRTLVRVNGAGLCFAREVMATRAVHAVRLAFPGGPGIVRVDQLTFSFSVQGRAEPVVVVVDSPGAFAGLEHDFAEPLSPNVLLGRHQAPQFIFTCPREWRDLVYRVEVEAAFAWLPTAALPREQPAAGDEKPLRGLAVRAGKKAARSVAKRYVARSGLR